jgi:hypothetical protein
MQRGLKTDDADIVEDVYGVGISIASVIPRIRERGRMHFSKGRFCWTDHNEEDCIRSADVAKWTARREQHEHFGYNSLN